MRQQRVSFGWCASLLLRWLLRNGCRLLRRLAVCADLFQYVPISQPSMSQHLKALSEAGLIESHKEGRNMHMSINSEKLQELEDFLQLLKPATVKA